MFSRNMAWKMKRALTGLLAAGLVLTSVPTPAVWAANEVLEEQHRPEEGEETSQQEPDQEEKPGTGEESGRPEKEEENQDQENQDKENQDTDNPDDKENLPDEENPDGSDTDTSDDENKPSDNTPDDNTPDEEDKTEQNPENPDAGEDTDSETPQPGTEESDEEEPGEEDAVTEEDTVPEKPVYTVQVSGNDISGNDLAQAESVQQWVYVEGGGSYQEGAFSVPDKSSGSRPRRAAAERAQQSAADYIYEQMKRKAAEIDLSEYNILVEDINSLVIGVVNDHPDLYFARTAYSYWSDGNGKVTKIKPEYIADTLLDDGKFKKGVQSALASVETGMTELEKAVALHD